MKEYKDEKKKEGYVEDIDEEFQNLAAQLSTMDFSNDGNKNFIFETTLKNINNKGDKDMNKIKKTGAVAATLLIVSTLAAQTSFAQEAVDKIINSIYLGHFSAVQMEESKEEEYILPDNLKGKIFDKNGSVLEKITRDIGKDGIYTKDGEKIVTWNAADGSVTTEKQEKEKEEKAKENTLTIEDSNKVNGYTCFEVKLPSYLPNEYKFEKAEFYKNSDKYASLYFKNQTTGKEIYMQQRFICDETRGDLATDDKIEKIKINGVDAVLEGEHSIEWEANSTRYFLAAQDMTRDETIKIAESIK